MPPSCNEWQRKPEAKDTDVPGTERSLVMVVEWDRLDPRKIRYVRTITEQDIRCVRRRETTLRHVEREGGAFHWMRARAWSS